MTGENGTRPPVRQLRLVVETEDYDVQLEADGQASAKLRIAFQVDVQ